ncbi:MAG: peptidase C45 [Planctomycetia bacterium]|nr:peptidase C45 [Planctomycetia bacterium]
MSSPPPTRYREIEAAGLPRELGRQIGEAARDEIRAFCQIALARVNKTARVGREHALAVAESSLHFAEDYAPHMVEELRGTAEAAGLTPVDLMLLQVRNQLKSEDAGCTSLSCASGGNGKTIVAQNWDNDPALDPLTIVLTRRPTGKPAFMSVTQAGLIAYVGFSDAGLGVCLNSLPAPAREQGVPHYFTVRGIYESRSLDEAAQAVRRAHRAIPANIMLATPQGPADLEVTLDDVYVLRDDHRLTHTNHGLHPALADANRRFPELIQSYPRKDRIDELLAGPARGTFDSVVAAQEALRDHRGHPRSICRHANDDPGHGFWQTVFSVVIEPSERRMHVSRGTPCCRPYETYILT